MLFPQISVNAKESIVGPETTVNVAVVFKVSVGFDALKLTLEIEKLAGKCSNLLTPY